MDDRLSNISGKIYRTNDYDIFKVLKGNRDVKSSRVNKIISSIKKVGYIQSPIIINENYEIIDGQGRLQALKKLGLPVDFIISPGAGIDECISMNINMENWTLKDYIDSYAERGNEDYIRLSILISELKVNLNIIATAAFGKLSMSSRLINSGNLVLSEEDYNKAKERIQFANSIIDSMDMKYIKGSKIILLQCLILCYDYEQIDRKKFIQQIPKNIIGRISDWSDVDECMRCIESAYNINLATYNKVMIYSIFREDRMKKVSRYTVPSRYR